MEELAGPVLAAGAVLWRKSGKKNVEIALVHRPKYDDWSLPKGKIESGEHALSCAYREVLEETGFAAAFGPELGKTTYLVDGIQKIVRYWNELYSSVEHDKNELVNLGQIIRTENPKLYDAYQRFHYLIESVYEIVPTADIHNNQFGYDKEGVLKCLDI